MENKRGREQETLINELKQGYELTKQLKDQIFPLASPESCEILIQKIISTYDTALSMISYGDLVGEFHQVAGIVDPTQSPSPKSEGSDFKDQCQYVYKKRKTLPRWTEQVRVCSGTGIGPLDDGHSWRKYGQKDILGANFPRAYYRCTHRNVQGCLATKQVQRSDKDYSIFEITYRGRHTCIQTPALASNGKEFPKHRKENSLPHTHIEQETLFKTEDLGIVGEFCPSFSFPSKPIIETQNVETNFFPDSAMEKDFAGNDSLAFLNPETSESNFFSLFGFGENFQNSESDLSEIISAPTSVTNSPIGKLDFFSLDQVEFDPNFPFDTSEFFS